MSLVCINILWHYSEIDRNERNHDRVKAILERTYKEKEEQPTAELFCWVVWEKFESNESGEDGIYVHKTDRLYIAIFSTLKPSSFPPSSEDHWWPISEHSSYIRSQAPAQPSAYWSFVFDATWFLLRASQTFKSDRTSQLQWSESSSWNCYDNRLYRILHDARREWDPRLEVKSR